LEFGIFEIFSIFANLGGEIGNQRVKISDLRGENAKNWAATAKKWQSDVIS
jgi:hypothetical protein